jgi:serine/threonine protein kinase
MSEGEDLRPLSTGSVLDDFEILEQIGVGGFSEVHLARHIPTSNYCAAKIVNLGNLNDHEFASTMREVSVFMQVEHPHICTLYRLSVHGTQLIFFMEFAPCGTLLDRVNRSKGLKEVEARPLFNQIFDAVRHLHVTHFLVHRDLKLENVLLDSGGNVKVTDFGLSGTNYNNLLRTFVGTPGYQPPEILANAGYTEKCDVWSLGVCLYAMVSSALPFGTRISDYRTLSDDAQRLVYPVTFSPLLVDLLKRMFTVRPGDRPGMMELQTHPWLHGLTQLGTNIAPRPIVFYQVSSIARIAKFKRRSIRPDPALLGQCVAQGIDEAALTEQLKNGATTAETTLYFMLSRPLQVKPVPLSPPVAVEEEPSSSSGSSTGRTRETRSNPLSRTTPMPIIPVAGSLHAGQRAALLVVPPSGRGSSKAAARPVRYQGPGQRRSPTRPPGFLPRPTF